MRLDLTKPSIHRAFWDRVNKDGPVMAHTPHLGKCWIWTGALNRSGYGACPFQKPAHLAHRFSWIIHNGGIPEKLWVLHKCDNPACVNPDHLFLGTQLDNTRDMIAKGRSRWDRNSKPTHCLRGHRFKDNLYINPDGWRCCQLCRRQSVARHAARKREATKNG